MKSGSQPVKMRVNGVDKVIGTATYPEYDAVAEAVDSVGEEKALEMINAQTRTNEMNRVRGLARQGPSKKELEKKALASITPDEWQSIAGDAEAIRKLLDEKIEVLRAEELATLDVSTGAPAEEASA